MCQSLISAWDKTLTIWEDFTYFQMVAASHMRHEHSPVTTVFCVNSHENFLKPSPCQLWTLYPQRKHYLRYITTWLSLGKAIINYMHEIKSVHFSNIPLRSHSKDKKDSQEWSRSPLWRYIMKKDSLPCGSCIRHTMKKHIEYLCRTSEFGHVIASPSTEKN